MLTLAIILPIIAVIIALNQAAESRRTIEKLREQINKQLAGSVASIDELSRKLRVLEKQVSLLAGRPGSEVSPAPDVEPLPESAPEPGMSMISGTPAHSMSANLSADASVQTPETPVIVKPPQPPPLPRHEPAVAKKTAKPTPAPWTKINLEQFIGANLMAWAAGLAAFIGVILFVKYAFDKNLIPPALRTAMGFMTGIGLVLSGLKMQGNKRFTVLSQALVATGVLVLYGVTFAAHALYQFPMFNAGVTLLLMTLITAAAFLMAVRMNAQVVAILGMVGGFLTPPLCSTGHDSPFGLFTYIALLDLGLLAVAKHKRWFHLAPLAAAGTAITQLSWMMRFFQSEHYDVGAKTWIVVLVFSAFTWLFTTAAGWINKNEPEETKTGGSALALSFVGMMAAFVMLDLSNVAARPLVMYSLVMLNNAAVLYLVWMQRPLTWAQAVIAAFTFLHLCIWTATHLTTPMLPAALTLYFLFGAVHTAFAVVSMKKHGPSPITGWIPVVTLILTMLPLIKLATIPFIVWPALMLVCLFAIGIALITRNVVPVLASLLLTLLSVLLWLGKLPVTTMSLLPFLMVLGIFSALFILAGFILAKRLPELSDNPLATQILPAASAVLPFVLLMLATLRLPIANPAPVFGFALALTVFLLILARIATQPLLVGAAAGCVLVLEMVWHAAHYRTDHPLLALPWYVAFLMLFTVYPLIVHPKWVRDLTVWIASVFASLGTFALVHWLVTTTWPNDAMGLIPAAFVLPSLGSLIWVLRRHPANEPMRLNQLAWLGGTTLFFFTLIFPLQFDKQWLTLAWALEGAALCWLFQSVPHRRLLDVACGLLSVAFARLALNPAVLSYHERSGTPIFNWFLYSYGIAAAAMFAAAYFVKRDERVAGVNLRSVFCSFGGVLLFLLMNIQIADVFTAPGDRFLTFDFSGHLARDMTYTISWATFALALLGIGFKVRSRFTRYAGIGLMGMTLLKLFFHDLAGIDGIYRIGALLVVAVLGFAASYLYQRFADREDR